MIAAQNAPRRQKHMRISADIRQIAKGDFIHAAQLACVNQLFQPADERFVGDQRNILLHYALFAHALELEIEVIRHTVGVVNQAAGNIGIYEVFNNRNAVKQLLGVQMPVAGFGQRIAVRCLTVHYFRLIAARGGNHSANMEIAQMKAGQIAQITVDAREKFLIVEIDIFGQNIGCFAMEIGMTLLAPLTHVCAKSVEMLVVPAARTDAQRAGVRIYIGFRQREIHIKPLVAFLKADALHLDNGTGVAFRHPREGGVDHDLAAMRLIRPVPAADLLAQLGKRHIVFRQCSRAHKQQRSQQDKQFFHLFCSFPLSLCSWMGISSDGVSPLR